MQLESSCLHRTILQDGWTTLGLLSRRRRQLCSFPQQTKRRSQHQRRCEHHISASKCGWAENSTGRRQRSGQSCVLIIDPSPLTPTQDAAVAAAAVLNLVDPAMTGIGGDAFALFYNSKETKVHALNGSGRSAEGATLDDVCHDLGITNRPYGIIPTTSAVAVTVPGGAAAWVDIVERFGSKSLSMAQVLAPAIELAEDGCPISEIASYFVGDSFVSPGRIRLTRRLVDRHRGGAPEKAEWRGASEEGPGCPRGLQGSPSGRGLSKSALSFHISATG